MTRPDPNPETGGRSLAEILREAGIDTSRSGRRRRWDDPDDVPIRQRRNDPESDGAGRPGYGRRRSDLPADVPSRREAPPRRPAPEPSTSAIPGLRPSQKPGVPRSAAAAPPEPETDVTPVPSRPAGRPAGARSAAPKAAEPTPVTSKAAPSKADPSAVPSDRAPERERRAADRRPARQTATDNPATGPIPVVAPDDIDDADDLGPRESALAWLRFGGELVIALAVGVGVYFAFTVVWEMLPYLAVLAAPLVVAGMVAGVGMWRRRLGRDPVSVKLLVVLVFAGTLLTIAPAAGLLASS